MPTTVNIPPDFRKQIKHLKRKYPSVVDEVRSFVLQLRDGQRPGDEVPDVGYAGVFKDRLRNRSARRGKRGGFRLIYYVPRADEVFLLLISSRKLALATLDSSSISGACLNPQQRGAHPAFAGAPRWLPATGSPPSRLRSPGRRMWRLAARSRPESRRRRRRLPHWCDSADR